LRLTTYDIIVESALRRKSQEIDQSQSNIKRIIDYDWLISCGLRFSTYDYIVESTLRWFYNKVVSRKSQEINQSQSTILFTFDCDWSISCDLRLHCRTGV